MISKFCQEVASHGGSKFDVKSFYDGRWLRYLVLWSADEYRRRGVLDDSDLEKVKPSRDEFDYCTDELLRETASTLRICYPSVVLKRSQVQILRYLVLRTIEAAFTIGAIVGISESTKQLLKIRQAEVARKARETQPRELALRKAILAERGCGPVLRPAKEAAAILTAVNARLKLDRFEEVNVDVIYRRLKKFPALLKTA